ncbi:MAG: D-tyrosyl-tRNA(Tyr) deacylase [Bacteroidetes bacterium]|nr:D-tyrosyl-tRNA(Tyr) deacylase [Bacteroidota bacterium]
MRVVIQRVSEALVHVGGKKVAEIGTGLLVLLGIAIGDTEEDALWLAKKTAGLRIFSDEAGQMNLSPAQVDAAFLVVSQFTLLADCRRGNRPSFIEAARPEQAIPLYEFFCLQIETQVGKPVPRGIFGADMKVALINDGPVTILMDSTERKAIEQKG